MKKYEIFLDDDKEHFTTSLVKDPAVEQTLLYFNTEKPLVFFNDEKRVIYSVAMRPNKLIFRKDINGEPAEVFYSKETVEKFQQKYFKFNGQSKTNINHSEESVKDVYPFESWIVMNKEIDKAKVLGLSVEDGDLVMGFKVENDDVWNECKNGNIDGLSIEAHFNNKEVNFKTEINMSKLEKVTAFFKELFAEDEKTPEQIAAEEEKAKKDAEAMAKDAPPTDAPDEEKAMLLEENAKLKQQVAELETKLATNEADKVKDDAELETMKKEIADVKSDFEKFKNETPASKPIANLPTEMKADKPFEEMTAFEKFRTHNNKFKK